MIGDPEPAEAAHALACAMQSFVDAVALAADPETVTITITADDSTHTVRVAAGNAAWLTDYIAAATANVTQRLEHPEDDLSLDVWGP